jgi:hypothetical protein
MILIKKMLMKKMVIHHKEIRKRMEKGQLMKMVKKMSLMNIMYSLKKRRYRVLGMNNNKIYLKILCNLNWML